MKRSRYDPKTPAGAAAAMRQAIVIIIAVCLTGVVHAQEQPQLRDAWNEIFSKRQGSEFPHNKFLAETVRGRQPGAALDIGIGEGRNALFLAAQGWEVTGFDISDVAVQMARDTAQRRGLQLKILVEDADRFDYGRQRWDLVVGMYMHEVITRNAGKIVEALKPGGILVVEGFHRDVNRRGVQGTGIGFRTNELPRAFDRLRILHYEDTVGTPDWGSSGQAAPLVRFIAVRQKGE
jgi:SAM-dependent methyltransferase